MASVNLSVAAVVALLFGLLVVRAVGVDECGFLCVDGTYVTCANYPNQQFPGCNCVCGPTDGQSCVVHNPDGSAEKDCPPN